MSSRFNLFQVVYRRFYFGETLKEIRGVLGLPGERVRQIEIEALGKMREYLDRLN